MSFSPLPAPGSAASSSIWARRMITKSVPTSDAEVELNVLSLLLDVPLASLDEQDLATSPVSLHSPVSPWSTNAIGLDVGHMDQLRSSSPSPLPSPGVVPVMQRSASMDYFDRDALEVHTAQTAVKAALDVLEEPSLSRGLRISTAVAASIGSRGCLTAPLSPSLSSPVSPAESCFSGTESDGTKKKGRARMSQEKRKRLARRREREALVAAITQQQPNGELQTQYQQHFSHSAPVTPIRSHFGSNPPTTGNASNGAFPGFPFGGAYEAFSTPLSSPRSSLFDLPSPALTTASTAGFGSVGTPSSSPTSLALDHTSCSPPTLVVQPPSPQRLRIKPTSSSTNTKPSTPQQHCWSAFGSHLASVY